MVLEYIALSIALESLIERLVDKVRSLRGVSIRFLSLASELETLRDVLGTVESSAQTCVDDNTQSLLKSCVQQATATCEELERCVNKVLWSKNKAVRGSWEKGNIIGLMQRLEGNKSTLVLLLGSISNGGIAKRRPQTREPSPPPPYYPSTSEEQYHSTKQALPEGNASASVAQRVAGLMITFGLYGVVVATVPASIPIVLVSSFIVGFAGTGIAIWT